MAFQVDGPSPDACWREVFSRIKKKKNKFRNVVIEEHKFHRTGSQMFGFFNRKVSLLIKVCRFIDDYPYFSY